MRENNGFLRYGRAFRGFFHRYINGSKGVISLFLAILMVPFVSIAGVLINAARVNSAIAVFDEALCNASNSTLGTYDKFLKKRFGLLAMSQDASGGGPGYTAENLLSDTFKFYMEQNLGALSNTYVETDATAAGVYPLTDTDVLLAEVMEYGKYSVPTKLVIDGFSLDSILKDLTKSLGLVESVFKTGSSGADLAVGMDECQESMGELEKALKACKEGKDAYGVSYSGFSSSVSTYNAMVAEMKVEVEKCDKKVEAAEAALAAADEDSYGAALAALEAAKKERQETIDKYHSNLIPLRAAVSADKGTYVDVLTDLAEKVKTAGDATKEAQESVDSVISEGYSFAQNVFTTASEGGKQAVKKNTETMTELRDSAKQHGDSETANQYDQQIQENKNTKVYIENAETLTKEGLTAQSTAVTNLDNFAKRELQSQYASLYNSILTLRNNVRDKYTVVQEDEAMEDTSPYYQDFTIPMKASEVVDLLDGLGTEIVSSSFFQVLKALVGFFKAIFTMDIWFDPALLANISNDAYSSVGGLPSNKVGNVPEFQEGDKEQSEYYKSIMGEYSGNALNSSSVSAFETTVNEIRAEMDTISDAWDNIHWYNVLNKLGIIAGAIISIGGHLLSLAGQMMQVIREAVYEKVLLAGYIGYNVPNRTTYNGGKALTGASYSLPGIEQGQGGKIFSGAETEYIMMGTNSEVLNQTLIFYVIYALRIIVNVPVVLMNGEVQSIATAAGAATFGIGTFVVYALYCLVEPLADTLILVNGSEIPIVKMKPYLTAGGVMDLISAFLNMKLTDGQKESVYSEVKGVMSGTGSEFKYAEHYADIPKDTGMSSVLGKFKMDYTQNLILIMLFLNTEGMLKRLADVIQMEATYNAATGGTATYQFNLSNSFTYLRASGSFSTNEFIRLSDGDGLNSPVRVVYRGY